MRILGTRVTERIGKAGAEKTIEFHSNKAQGGKHDRS